jgi:hypothetical protein
MSGGDDGGMERRARHARLAAAMQRSFSTRAEFADMVGDAIAKGRGFAAGKLGTSQQHWMVYPILRAHARSPLSVAAFFSGKVAPHALNNAGVFPATPEFLLRYNEIYVANVRALDSVGLFLEGDDMETMIVRHYGLERLIHFQDQEPDRAADGSVGACFLSRLRGARVLIVCPFAGLLRQRATAATYEAVWSKLGKKWFEPAAVDALEFPYGVATSTRVRYPDVLHLLDEIRAELDRRTYDVALIGAAGLAIPLAAHAKSRGKVAIDLGGHLQIIFGVIGKRWRAWPEWRDRYFNAHWIDMPERHRPDEDGVCDDGAYW